jgi:hypothetical protein
MHGSNLLGGATPRSVQLAITNLEQQHCGIIKATDTRIVFEAPAGCLPANLQLTSGGGYVTTAVLTYPAPTLQSLHWHGKDVASAQSSGMPTLASNATQTLKNPQIRGGTTKGGAQFLVAGTNFGPSVERVICTLAGQRCRIITMKTAHRELVVAMPPGTPA